MDISYDAAKNAQNIARGRPSFEVVAEFDFQTALVFTSTLAGIRAISFRKASTREVRHYEDAQ